MSGLNLSPHQFRTRPQDNTRVLVSEEHYVRLSGPFGTFFVQSGSVWDAGGVEVKDPPSGFWEEYAKVSPEMQKLVGLSPRKQKQAA